MAVPPPGLHGGGGPQIGEVTRGGSPNLSCKRDQIKKRKIMWTGELTQIPEVPHLHVNMPLVMKPVCFCVLKGAQRNVQ